MAEALEDFLPKQKRAAEVDSSSSSSSSRVRQGRAGHTVTTYSSKSKTFGSPISPINQKLNVVNLPYYELEKSI